MFEDKSKVNYPYEYAETTTKQIKNPDYTKFKNSTGTHNFPISKHYVEKTVYSNRVNSPKNK
ncbi:hypothetical protein D0U04_06295 [Bacillus clarus]|uniref:Group-specific protein n=1 Tax=Bacillus clarus TaxID=2338372 RepID=A0A090Z137_9BACI|nr:hypothetical protein [Bacillus clarus]KFN04058.1 hypothetical protein DJ93_609 [Bacillus clarus]RFT67707.1 hypothetical protein D0U04_06295 [Bacillus clarus]